MIFEYMYIQTTLTHSIMCSLNLLVLVTGLTIFARSCVECQGLLRPNVVWFGEALDSDVMKTTYKELESCDLCLLVSCTV